MSERDRASAAWTRGHRAPLSYHAMLLLDPHRMDAYERAIRTLVRPGSVVLDLGCGTGILAMLAARRGALRVHAVESMPISSLALEIVRANGLADRVRVHQGEIQGMEPVEPVDLVVSDFMGRFLVDDGMLPAVAAAGRWLKPGGAFCPSRVRLLLAPAGDLDLRPVEVFEAPFYGIDFRAAVPRALHTCYPVRIAPGQLMAPPQEYHDLAPPAPAAPFDRTLEFRLERGGLLAGVAGWFEATLAPGVLLASEPGVETHWGQYLFPLPGRLVEPGDGLRVRLRLEDLPDGDVAWRWEGALARAGSPDEPFALSSTERPRAGSPPP